MAYEDYQTRVKRLAAKKKRAAAEAKKYLAWRRAHGGFVTAAEAARFAGVSRPTVSKAIRPGEYGRGPRVKSAEFKLPDGHVVQLVELAGVLELMPRY